jgi:predicted kinase
MKKAILTMGLGGAGKSTIIDRDYAEFKNIATLIDPDRIKEEKEDYDPKQPEVYHVWSKEEAKKRMMTAMVNGENLIIDGTGTNVEKMAKWINELQVMGYTVELLYVQVSLQTALCRNSQRDRVVPEHIIREKADFISTAFEILSSRANIVTVKNND